jgi:hypothetical protein
MACVVTIDPSGSFACRVQAGRVAQFEKNTARVGARRPFNILQSIAQRLVEGCEGVCPTRRLQEAT